MNHSSSQSISIHVPLNGNELLSKVLEIINSDIEIRTLWNIINTNAIDRLGMSDHGPVHFQIVANTALRLCRILTKNQIEMSVCVNFKLGNNYAELIILLASLFHDLGMSINRDGHEEFSLIIANGILHRILEFIPVQERTIVISETLHAIISHRSGGRPQTIEGGIVRVADALDMCQGRSRIAYEAGNIDIFSVSAYAIDKVEISEGKNKLIQIDIDMNNSAGIFQVEDLLKSKVKNSGIEQFLEVKAFIKKDQESNLIKEYSI